MKENILDNYALNRLTNQEKTLLRKALQTEPSFQEELEFHRTIVQGIEVHMEQLIETALADVLIYADQDLKDSIQQVDLELESELFFEPKKVVLEQPFVDVEPKYIPQTISTSKEPIEIIPPEITETSIIQQEELQETPPPSWTPIDQHRPNTLPIIIGVITVLLALYFISRFF